MRPAVVCIEQRFDIETIEGEKAKSTTLPLWAFDVHSSRDGKTYPAVIVGLDPFSNPGSVSMLTNVAPVLPRAAPLKSIDLPERPIPSSHRSP